MNNILVLGLMFLSSAALAAGKGKASETQSQKTLMTSQVDVAHSKLTWKADKKMAGGHAGTVSMKAGEVTFEKDKLTGGHFKIDMKSIKVTDITDAKDNQKLVGHLNSDDFFAVEKNPEADLAIKTVKETTPGKYEVTGELQIKGVTKPVTFPVEVSKHGQVYSANGKLIVDRTQYGIKYNSEVLGVSIPVDRIIKDQFELNFDLTTK